jgi:hypothetical protein
LKPRRKLLAVVLILGAALSWMGWRYLLGRAYVQGDTWAESIGGGWVIQYHQTPLSHSGATAQLLRRTRNRTTVVGEAVSAVRYLGDDCVVYATARGTMGPEYLAVCSDRPPVVLVAPTYEEWRVTDTGLVKYAGLGDKRAITSISLTDIKKRALGR